MRQNKYTLLPYILKYKWHYAIGVFVLMTVDLANLYIPQFIGEISEVPALDEDGMSEYSFILTGYALKNNIDYLFNVAELLKKQYKPSKTINGVVIIYDNFIQIDTNNDELKQIQINLKIKKWSV